MTWLTALAGLVLLVVGGEMVVRGAARLARRFGVSALAVGLTVVAFGTSAPELSVSVEAGLLGKGELAVGNVVGSNIANIGLILGIVMLVRPARAESRIVRWEAPLLIGVSLVLVVLLRDGALSRVEGTVLFTGLVAWTVLTLRAGRSERPAVVAEFEAGVPGASGVVPAEGVGPVDPSALPDTGAPPLRRREPTAAHVFLVIVGLALLIAGGRWLVLSATDMARAWGLSEAVIGLTLVAVGTSLPELAMSMIAAIRGQADIAVGNVIGSNLFNIMGILGVAALVRPLDAGAIGWGDLAVMAGAAVLVLPMLYTGRRLSRMEGGILLAGWVAYTVWLVVR